MRPSITLRRSERSRHAQHVLADVGEDEIGRNRRYLVETRLAELALDVVLAGEAESAVRLQAGVRRFPGCLRGEKLGHVGFRSARLPRIEQRTHLESHQVGRLELDVTLGDGKLHRLVFPDRPIEHDPLRGVTTSTLDEPPSIAYAFGRDQRALGIESVEDVAKALSLGADQVLRRYLKIV